MNVTFLKKGSVRLCSLFLGVVFVFSGFVKLVDPMGGAIKISDYLKAFYLTDLSMFVADHLSIISLVGAFNLAAAEFTLGVCLILGVYRRYVSFITLLFMSFMTPLTLYLALFNPVSDCGCFGDALVLTNWQTFIKNIILLVAAIYVFINNQKVFQVYTFMTYWFVTLFTYMFALGFAYYNYTHLPILDFRPYKLGANIPKLMEIPEDAPQDEYEYTFVYEKDGVKKKFTMDNYPVEDSTWTFVDSQSKLIKRGFVPVIESFDLLNEAGEFVTDDILFATEPVWLLILPDIADADSEKIEEICSLSDYAMDHNMRFYGVTGSDRQYISRWLDYTGGEYEVLTADKILLKTIIRSNPGLVLLKEGTILGKWHYNDFPDEEAIDEVVKSALANKYVVSKKQEGRRVATNLLTFTVPLLCVWVYDFFRFRKRREKTKKEKEDK